MTGIHVTLPINCEKHNVTQGKTYSDKRTVQNALQNVSVD